MTDDDLDDTVKYKKDTKKLTKQIMGDIEDPGGLVARVVKLEFRQKIMWGAFTLLGADMARDWAGLGG